jgi:hypothetical protein
LTTNNASEATGGHSTQSYPQGFRGHNTQRSLEGGHNTQPYLEDRDRGGPRGNHSHDSRTHSMDTKGGGPRGNHSHDSRTHSMDTKGGGPRGNHSHDSSHHNSSLLERGIDRSGLPKFASSSSLPTFASTHKLIEAPWFVNETHDWALEGDAARIYTLLYPHRHAGQHTHTHTHTHTHSFQRVD